MQGGIVGWIRRLDVVDSLLALGTVSGTEIDSGTGCVESAGCLETEALVRAGDEDALFDELANSEALTWFWVPALCLGLSSQHKNMHV